MTIGPLVAVCRLFKLYVLIIEPIIYIRSISIGVSLHLNINGDRSSSHMCRNLKVIYVGLSSVRS